MKQQLLEDDEFVLPSSAPELQELATELWHKYFALGNPPKPTDESRKLLKQYNLTAKELNKRSGKDVVICITPSTRWIPSSKGATDPAKKKVLAGSSTPTAQQPVKKPVNNVKQPVNKPSTGGKIEQIINLHKQGKTNKEIIALGYNKNTVNINISSYIKTGKSTTARV